MFNKLRRRLIVNNLAITGLVILIVFSAVFMGSISSADRRPPIPNEMSPENYPSSVEDIVSASIREEKEAAAENLLKLLIISGITIEIAVAMVSYYLAELAIRPVRQAYEAQKVFIANASHEIKTPLAAIAANLEAADIHGNKWIRNVERETEKLTALNGELLTLARTDLMREHKTESVDVAKNLNDVLESYTPRLKKRTLVKKILLTRNFEINREDFVQVINILLDNAVKYSDKKIILEAHDNIILISNDGIKIDAADLPHVFERFYQADKTAEGVGLGLSIAKSIADNNGWKLSAESSNMTTFILQI